MIKIQLLEPDGLYFFMILYFVTYNGCNIYEMYKILYFKKNKRSQKIILNLKYIMNFLNTFKKLKNSFSFGIYNEAFKTTINNSYITPLQRLYSHFDEETKSLLIDDKTEIKDVSLNLEVFKKIYNELKLFNSLYKSYHNDSAFKDNPQVIIKKVNKNKPILPTIVENSVGIDLYVSEDILLCKHKVTMIPTNCSLSGTFLLCKDNIFGMIVGRSSTPVKKRVLIITGVIDPTYTGEIFILGMPIGNEDIILYKGDKIAQMLPMYYCKCNITDYETIKNKELLNYMENLSLSSRGKSCCGSSGLSDFS